MMSILIMWLSANCLVMTGLISPAPKRWEVALNFPMCWVGHFGFCVASPSYLLRTSLAGLHKAGNPGEEIPFSFCFIPSLLLCLLSSCSWQNGLGMRQGSVLLIPSPELVLACFTFSCTPTRAFTSCGIVWKEHDMFIPYMSICSSTNSGWTGIRPCSSPVPLLFVLSYAHINYIVSATDVTWTHTLFTCTLQVTNAVLEQGSPSQFGFWAC